VTDAYERHTAQLFDRVLAAKAAPDAAIRSRDAFDMAFAQIKAELEALRQVAGAARVLVASIDNHDGSLYAAQDHLDGIRDTLHALDRLSLPHDPYSHKTGRAII